MKKASLSEKLDTELFDLIKGDDVLAFKELFNRRWESLYILAFALLNNEDLSKDILKDIFVDIWSRRDEIEHEYFGGYLRQAVRFSSFNELRKKGLDKEQKDFLEMSPEEFKKIIKKAKQGIASSAELEILKTFENHFVHKNKNQAFASDLEKLRIQDEIIELIGPKKATFNWVKVAAALVIAISILSSLWIIQSKSEKEHWLIAKTELGETKKVEMEDGSVFTLNSNSELFYTDDFKTNRRIELDGEAFFKVSKDPNHPFIVNGSTLKTTVLGTEFSMSNYPHEQMAKVVLFEGSVKVEMGEKSEILKPGEKLEWNSKKEKMAISPLDSLRDLGWIN